MHDALYQNQEALGSMLYLEKELALAMNDLRLALDVETYRARVRADFIAIPRSGKNGTPAFLINGQWHDDACDFVAAAETIEAYR